MFLLISSMKGINISTIMMQQNGKIEASPHRNIFQELLAAKKRVSIEPSSGEETLEAKQNVRMRRFSQKLIGDEVKELEKRHNQRDKKLKAPEDMCNSEAKFTSLKNITFDRFLKKDLETHIQSLEKEGDALTREEEEDLGYETFKMAKQKEKIYLSDLRDRINSGSISTQTTLKYKSLLAYSHRHLGEKRQI